MTDRKPLSEVEDRGEVEQPKEDLRQQTVSDQAIDEMQDMHELSLMLGFEHGFNGAGPDVENVWAWAKDYVGEPGGAKVINHIKNTIKLIGATEKGTALLKKLSLYSKLDTKQAELQMRKENLYDI